jgi:pimeloyl-ACP methyl ester carboxylesterase
MSEPTLNFVDCPDATGGHRMAWWQWGNPAASHVVVCVHGLSRQGRDFDVLAQALCARAGSSLRVVCPDVAGRGQSDWLKDPMSYQISTYAADMLVLLQQLNADKLDWVGTSMGALIGMAICGQPESPFMVRKLVINDIGPALQCGALRRIGAYLGQPVRFSSLEQAADAMWLISTSFGPHTREQWLALSRHMIKPATDAQGGFTLHYDPAISVAFGRATPESTLQGEAQMWQLYDNIGAETLLIRGAQSDLLSPETARAMTQRGPCARLVEFAGVGHAPTFVAPDQVQVVSDFLLGPQ